MKTLSIVVLAGVVTLSTPVAAQEDLTNTVTNMVVEQSAKALDTIQAKLSDELSKKLDAAMANMSFSMDVAEDAPQAPAKVDAPATQDKDQH
ncbi:hypothetical protein PVT67_03155 [Gallaecimonas kandeliae]|uniref:hypothetical protein n=1 Tax=Gallaecimonas kandeliae TaxID=3029055 RepID=UPI0026491FBF|nr:hypothetical protein [Gallaecimonas kandeliae]WKE66262.1 hypothetical protein PVT67_03155 [Gallaecimonas kandeliae]